MNKFEQVAQNIFCLKFPYKGIFTTVYLIKTDEGITLVDAASYDSDITDILLPALADFGVDAKEIKYVFITHNHGDHSGGLGELLRHLPHLTVISRSDALREKHSDNKFISPDDNDIILGVLKVVTIPGHTPDSAALLDTRTNTLVCGDCLQMYGIYGEGKWAANIRLPAEHLKALEKLRGIDFDCVITAHDYHPHGRIIEGREKILAVLDSCAAPLYDIKALIEANPEIDDAAVCALYNSTGNLPTLGDHVVTAVRRELL